MCDILCLASSVYKSNLWRCIVYNTLGVWGSVHIKANIIINILYNYNV